MRIKEKKKIFENSGMNKISDRMVVYYTDLKIMEWLHKCGGNGKENSIEMEAYVTALLTDFYSVNRIWLYFYTFRYSINSLSIHVRQFVRFQSILFGLQKKDFFFPSEIVMSNFEPNCLSLYTRGDYFALYLIRPQFIF